MYCDINVTAQHQPLQNYSQIAREVDNELEELPERRTIPTVRVTHSQPLEAPTIVGNEGPLRTRSQHVRNEPVAVTNAPPIDPPQGAALLAALNAMQSPHVWCHQIAPAMMEGGEAKLLGSLKLNLVANFFAFSAASNNSTKYFLVHTCVLPSKQKCRCVGLDLITLHVKKLNCNYFQSNTGLNAFAWMVCAAKRSHYRCIALSVNGHFFRFGDVTAEVFAHFHFSKVGSLFEHFPPARRLIEKWNFVYGESESCAPIYPSSAAVLATLDEVLPDSSLLKCKNEKDVELVCSLLWTFLPFPLTHLYKVDEIEQSQLRYIDSTSPEYREAMRRFQLDFNRMLTPDLFAHIASDKCQPVFNTNKQYLSRQRSVELVEQWLAFQFPDDVERFTWVRRVRDILLQVNDCKMRCIWLYGPASSGKSYTISSLAELFIQVGHINVIDANYAFNFQGCANQRIILMDEAEVPASLHKEFLQLLSGGSLHVNVKNKAPELIPNMAVIMLSNNADVVDYSQPVWYSRIFRSDVQALPNTWPIQTSHIFPSAWLDIFDKYK